MSRAVPGVFLVCPSEMVLARVPHLAAALPDAHVTGLLPARVGRKFDPTMTVVDLARALAPAIREGQPHGPVVLLGHSFAGIVAYQLARQLRHEGRDVALVGLLDTVSPDVQRRLREEYLRQVTGWRSRWRRVRQGQLLEIAANGLRRFGLAPGGSDGRLPDEDDFDYEGAWRLILGYQAGPYDGVVTVLASQDTLRNAGVATLGWEGVLDADSLRTASVPGDHLSMLLPPQVDALASAIDQAMQGAGVGR